MRAIKFRAWDKKVRRFVSNCNYHIDLNGDVFWEFAYNEPQFVSKDELEIMQYTGLKDKNGKKIYEGDILEGEAPTGLVKFGIFDNNQDGSPEHNCGSGFYFESRDGISSLSALLVGVYKYKVIGNIYENPELLEK